MTTHFRRRERVITAACRGDLKGARVCVAREEFGVTMRERGGGGVFFREIPEGYDGKTNALVRAARDGFAG